MPLLRHKSRQTHRRRPAQRKGPQQALGGILALLSGRFGLRLPPASSITVERCIRARMKLLKVSTLNRYLSLLENSPREIRLLIGDLLQNTSQELDAAKAQLGKIKTENIQRAEWEKRIQEIQRLESLGAMAGGLAHEFNNLLATIVGNASLLQAALPPSTEHARRFESINHCAQRASDLCQQMLAYAGHGQFALRALELNDLIHDMTELLRVSVSDSAELRFDLCLPSPRVQGDSIQLQQLVMNLVLNASESLEGKPGLIELTTGTVHADPDYLERARLSADLVAGPYSFLHIRDTGCGMTPETLARAFEPFYTTKFIGRGLGLAATAGILRRHHGGLIVETTPGKGSSFRLLFPQPSARTEEGAVDSKAKS